MRAAIEARTVTREALDRKRERFTHEMKQIWDRYYQDRGVELEREDKAIRDAEGKVKCLEGDHRNYKHRSAAADAQLREHTPTGSPNTGESPGGGRPSAAPASPALSGDSKDDPPHMQKIGAEFNDFRNSASPILTCPSNNLSISSCISMRSKWQRRGGTAWIGQSAAGPLRRAPEAKAPRGTSRTIETGPSAITAGGTPESVTPATDLLRDPGDEDEADGMRRLRQSRS